MRSVLTLLQIFTLADWVIAFFIAGTAAKIEGRNHAGKPTGRRPLIAVGIAVLFTLLGVARLLEFVNLAFHQAELTKVLGQVSESYTVSHTLIAALRTVSFLFCWFAITCEVRERTGIISGNVIRNFLAKELNKLR